MRSDCEPLPPLERPLEVEAEDPRHRRCTCVFCDPPTDRIFLESSHVRGIWAPEPAAPEHAILFTREPTGNWFRASRDEQAAIAASIDITRDVIEERRRAKGQALPAGYAIHFATGASPERRAPHLHVDVVPRDGGG